MSDADRLRRLRAAADLCDAWAADTKAANSALLTSWKIDAATAALLRAVADASWCACPSGTAAHDAALALADTILGGES